MLTETRGSSARNSIIRRATDPRLALALVGGVAFAASIANMIGAWDHGSRFTATAIVSTIGVVGASLLFRAASHRE